MFQVTNKGYVLSALDYFIKSHIKESSPLSMLQTYLLAWKNITGASYPVIQKTN